MRDLVTVDERGGGGCHVDKGVEEEAHSEVPQCRAEEQRTRLAGEEPLLVVVGAYGVEEIEFTLDRMREIAELGRLQRGSSFLLTAAGTVGGAGIAPYLAVSSVDHAGEIGSGADGPRDGCRDEPQLLLYVVDELQSTQGRTVDLVDESKEGDAAAPGDLEQLERL